MLLDLIRAVGAGVAAMALPGYFWAVFLRPAGGLAERLAYSCALSLASVPVVAVVLAGLGGSGITAWIALAAPGIVLASGMLAVALRGAATGPAGPVFPGTQAIRGPWAVAAAGAGSVGALIMALHHGYAGVLILPVLALLALAAVLARPTEIPDASLAAVAAAGPARAVVTVPPATQARQPAGAPSATRAVTAPAAAPPAPGPPAAAAPERAGGPGGHPSRWAAIAHAAVFTVVLALSAVRAYEPVLRYDWPSVRGLDSFSHAVMAEQMLAHGSYRTYLIYPPGFPAISAVISRLSGLSPLALFPVIAPALLVLSTMAAYALAARLWGRWYGIAAAALAGLVLHGAFAGFADGRYPDLISAYFLITMGIAALIALYQSPGWRSVALMAVLGAAPVFYHQVATLYEAMILVLAAITALPYLWHRGRRAEARMVLAGLVAVTLLATCYAWYTYGLGWPVVHHSASSAAVSMVLGSQPPPPAIHLLKELAAPVIWLGVLGVVLMAMRVRPRLSPPQACAAALILLWCVLMYVGSRTAADGFPFRFERDLGAALSVTGALGLGVIVKSLWQAWRRTRVAPAVLGMVALVIPVVAVGVQAVQGAKAESHPARLLSAPVLAAGDWVMRHNTGGTIVATALNHGITERAALAITGYPALQYYGRYAGRHPRSLPPAGRKPLLESREILEDPGSCASAAAIAAEDVRYVLLYRGAGQQYDLAAFRAHRGRYHEVFENSAVVVYAPTAQPCS
ncbi:MAG: hypothetical protein LBI49_25295 [Nocardiopsaceae bacterium]|jgi:hypothetical protein|nr:hypothetical protein [Nocardiopsaceae bacterium]